MVWLLLVGFLLFLVAIAIAFALTMRVAVKWGHEFVELEQFGVPAEGRVVEKRQIRRRGRTSTWMRYEYVDQFGKTHRSRRTLVTPEAWTAHVEGGPMAIVYSQRRPQISLPKYLMALKPAPGEVTSIGRSEI